MQVGHRVSSRLRPGPMQRWTSEPRQVRKEAAVVGFTCAVGCLATFVSELWVGTGIALTKTTIRPGIRVMPRRLWLSFSSAVLYRGASFWFPGCGTGHDVRLLAEQGASVVGLDIAPSAVRKAESMNAADNVQYHLGDFLDLQEQYVGSFDYVFEHTCLCAIDPYGAQGLRGVAEKSA